MGINNYGVASVTDESQCGRQSLHCRTGAHRPWRVCVKSCLKAEGVAFPCREKDMKPSGLRQAGRSRGRSVGFLGSCYEVNCVPQKRYAEVLTHSVFSITRPHLGSHVVSSLFSCGETRKESWALEQQGWVNTFHDTRLREPNRSVCAADAVRV